MTKPTDAHQEDISLMQRLHQQDQAALTELYERYSRPVFNMALRVLQNRELAEEITQDMFMQIWKEPHRWDANRGKLSSWLLTVTRYAAIDRLRKERRQDPLEHPQLNDSLTSKARFDEPGWEDRRILHRLLATLPKEQRQAIFLAYFRGMTHEEIAEHLSLPLGTVKSRIRLGLDRIRTGWKEAVQLPDII